MSKLVKGYMIRTVEMLEAGTEQLFAVSNDGVIRTCIKKYSSHFGVKGVKWDVINELPKEAEFIGHYRYWELNK
jgi:hypothetical protein